LTASETSSTSSSNDGNEQEGSDALFMSL
jgi:hypothetical protein